MFSKLNSYYLSLSIILLCSCGGEYQPKEFPKNPNPSAVDFELPDEVNVLGSTMMFKPEIEAKDLAAITHYSVSGRLETVRKHHLNIQKNTLNQSINNAHKNFEPYLLNSVDPAALLERRRVGLEVYDTWTEVLQQGKNKSTRILFESYCEAKIWDYAMSDSLLKTPSSLRPTPAQVCEGFYKEAQLLSQSQPLCSEDNKDKDFFKCFWLEGLLKTNLFQSQFSKASRDTILSWLEPLETNKNKTILQEVLSNRYANLFRKAALSFKPLKSRKFDKLLGEFDSVKDAFVLSEAPNKKIFNKQNFFGEEVLKGFSIDDIRKSVELESGQCQGLCLVSEDEKIIEMREILRSFSNGALKGKKAPDLNDVLFNVSEIDPKKINKVSFIEVASVKNLSPLFANSGEELKSLEGLVNLLETSTMELSKTENEIRDTKTKITQFGNQASKLIVSKSSVAYTFFPFGAKVSFKRNPDYLSLTIAFRQNLPEAKALAACLDPKSLQQIDCPESSLTSEKYLKMNILDGGKLLSDKYISATVPINDVEELGFAYMLRSSSSGSISDFNEIEPSLLNGKTMRVGFQFNQIENLVNVATVSIVFLDAGNKVLFEGGQTLIQN